MVEKHDAEETRRVYIVDHPSGSGFMIAIHWSTRSRAAGSTVARSELLQPSYQSVAQAREVAVRKYGVDPATVIVIAKGA